MTFLHRNIACNYCVAFLLRTRRRAADGEINGFFTRHLQYVFLKTPARPPEKKTSPQKPILSSVALSQMKDRFVHLF